MFEKRETPINLWMAIPFLRENGKIEKVKKHLNSRLIFDFLRHTFGAKVWRKNDKAKACSGKTKGLGT